jgi:hypothetical protein
MKPKVTLKNAGECPESRVGNLREQTENIKDSLMLAFYKFHVLVSWLT